MVKPDDIIVVEHERKHLGRVVRAGILINCDVALSDFAMSQVHHRIDALHFARARAKREVWNKLYGGLYTELHKLNQFVRYNMRPECHPDEVDQAFSALYEMARPPT